MSLTFINHATMTSPTIYPRYYDVSNPFTNPTMTSLTLLLTLLWRHQPFYPRDYGATNDVVTFRTLRVFVSNSAITDVEAGEEPSVTLRLEGRLMELENKVNMCV